MVPPINLISNKGSVNPRSQRLYVANGAERLESSSYPSRAILQAILASVVNLGGSHSGIKGTACRTCWASVAPCTFSGVTF